MNDMVVCYTSANDRITQVNAVCSAMPFRVPEQETWGYVYTVESTAYSKPSENKLLLLMGEGY